MTEVKPPHPAAPLRTDGAAGRSQDGAGLWPLVETLATLWGTVNGGAHGRNGFRVKPSFGQVLGYIAESEPASGPAQPKASIYTSSHWYLNDCPNAPEPISEASTSTPSTRSCF